MEYTFDSKFTILDDFPADYPKETVKNEPMLFNCDFSTAYNLGGQITKGFLTSLPRDWQNNVVVDSRVHMLMSEWSPAIPGFHHDDIPRTGANGQPNYDNPEYLSEHVMGLVNGDICPTIYAVGKHKLPKVADDKIIYGEWHPMVEQQIADGTLEAVEAESGKIIHFDWQAMHTAQGAKTNGWRWFIRVSRNTERVNNVTNELRRQVQIYMKNPNKGW